MLARSTCRAAVRRRHALWARAFAQGMSISQIARRWGVHHTTIAAALDKPHRSDDHAGLESDGGAS
ncbi:helix-turn-helix domain-containing protein [Pendulispora brunnea]